MTTKDQRSFFFLLAIPDTCGGVAVDSWTMKIRRKNYHSNLSFAMLRLLLLFSVLCFSVAFSPKCGIGRASSRGMLLNMKNPVFDLVPQLHFADGFVNSVKSLEENKFVEHLVSKPVRAVVPKEVIHWAHPVIFSTLLLGLGLSGLKYGVDIKKFREKRGVSQAEYKEARKIHPQIMTYLMFTALIGTASGIASNLALGEPLLDSWHSVTAVALVGGLVGQYASGNWLESHGNQNAVRLAHRVFGMGSMTLLFLHLATGLSYAFDSSKTH